MLKERIIKDVEIKRKWDKTQHSFIQGKLCQTNVISFCDKITDFFE